MVTSSQVIFGVLGLNLSFCMAANIELKANGANTVEVKPSF